MSARNAKRRQRPDDAGLALPPSRDDANPSTRANDTLEAVYREEAPRLTRYFRSRLNTREDAADLTQEAFTRLAKFMAQGPLARPAAYLQRIARNLLYDRSKRIEARLSAFHLPIGEGAEPSVAADQDWALEAEDLMRIYLQALDELAPRTREVFLLHRVEELPYREIGLRLAISVPTVQYHVARALAHIDAALDRG